MDRANLERKLRIRSWRRGTKEMDLLLGRFADARLASLCDSEIQAYSALLDRGDPEISDILFGNCPPRDHASIAARIRMHHAIGRRTEAGEAQALGPASRKAEGGSP